MLQTRGQLFYYRLSVTTLRQGSQTKSHQGCQSLSLDLTPDLTDRFEFRSEPVAPAIG